MSPLAGLGVRVASAAPAVVLAGRLLADLGADLGEGDVVLGGDGEVSCRLPAFPAGVPPQGDVAAAAGLYDPPVGRPRQHALGVATTIAALWAAIAAVAARRAVEAGGPGRAIEVPLLDAGLSAHELSALLAWSPPRRWVPIRWAGSPLVATYRCGDGRWIQLHAGLPAHAARLADALGGLALTDETRRDPIAFATVREARRVGRLLAERFTTRPAQAWEDALSAADLCVAVCRTPEEWRAHPQRGADALVRVADGASAPFPSPPDGRGPPLAGIRVLDASQVIAGPVAGRALAALGAEVTKIVNPRWDQPWAEAFRTIYDAGKRPVVADLTTAEGRALLARLLAGTHVVVHNLRPAAAERCGLGEDALRGMVRAVISAYGADGPWAGRPGWEQTAQAAVGTELDYGGGHPELVPLPATDLCTGLAAALGVVAALRAGVPARVEVALTAAAALLREAGPEGLAPSRRTGLRTAFAARPHLVRRSVREGIGTITEVGLPVRMAGFATFPSDLVASAPVAPRDVRWAADTARWAAWVATSRLRR